MHGSKCEKTLFEVPDLRLLLHILFLRKLTSCFSQLCLPYLLSQATDRKESDPVLKKYHAKVPGILV